MKTKQTQELNFYRKIRMSLGLMGILPFLFVTYLFLTENISLSNTLIISSALILFSILMGFTLLRQSADQLTSLARETSVIGQQDDIKPVQLTIEGELKDIASNFNLLIERLDRAKLDIQEQNIKLLRYADDLARSYEQLKKEELLRTHLSRYIDNDLVEQIMHSDGNLLLHNQRKVLTVMFADIRSFTSISEQMRPEDVVAMLNEYFSIMVEIIFKNNGMLDKFAGDQLMAVFGHISGETEGAKHALLCALEMQQAVDELMSQRAKKRLPLFQVGIGINTGSVIIGNVGSENRMDYTVIGNTVNIAARLEEQAKGGEIYIGDRTLGFLPKSIKIDKRFELKAKNCSKPIVCHRVMRRKPARLQAEKGRLANPLEFHTPYPEKAMAGC